MYRYEVWDKSKWDGSNNPEATFSTLDLAMDEAKNLSSGRTDLFYFVLDKSQSPSRVRGFGIKGKWFDAVDTCKRCGNSGEDYTDWSDIIPCQTCKGASWKPF